VTSFFFLGLGTVGFGIILIWIPFIGIPLIIFGLVFIFLSLVSLIVKIIVKLRNRG
jgi:hypothetical protein